ncbi:hypothetical protein [Treponema zioleckii]|uniref:hypothetical protein n=1 Tax=Treponema zioleckii TaxID=331680 RepID=UPI00168A9122|nr:hypothetical protein [Treponema zioleckii]
MIELKRIVYFLILAYFFIRFVVIPAVRIVTNLVKLARLKKEFSKFGDLIVKVNDTKKLHKIGIILGITGISLFISLAALEKEPFYLFFIIFLLPQILHLILMNKYSEHNGFYQNGIVKGGFLEWEYIFSYKKIDSDTLSFLKQDGLRFDFGTAGKMQEVIDLISTRGIKEE